MTRAAVSYTHLIAQEGNLSAEMLDEYAREQRLTGILVLDQHLNVLEQTANDRDVRPLWQKLIESDYVRDITEHPEKTYTTRLRNEGKDVYKRQDIYNVITKSGTVFTE